MAGLVIAMPLGAQADRIDAGSFSILHNGLRVGREQFSLRRAPAPDGAVFDLRSELNIGDRRTAVQLSADSLGSPIHYSVEIRDSAAVAVRLGGQRVRGRFATQARRAVGETAREYLLVPGTLILEADFFHQLCFVVRGRSPVVGEAFLLPVISPLENAPGAITVTLESNVDFVTIAGVRRPARRWRVADREGLVRTVWADADGRILRVLIPSRQIEAIRDDIPR